MADVYSQIGNGLIEHLGFEPYFHIKLAMNMGYPRVETDPFRRVYQVS